MGHCYYVVTVSVVSCCASIAEDSVGHCYYVNNAAPVEVQVAAFTVALSNVLMASWLQHRAGAWQ